MRRVGKIDRVSHEATSESLSSIVGIYGWIEQEGMRAAACGDVDEPHEPIAIESAYEAETAREDVRERSRYVLGP